MRKTMKKFIAFALASAMAITASVPVVADVDSESVKYGDANCDGKVDFNDAQLVLKDALGFPTDISEQGRINSDVDQNEKVDLKDAMLVLKAALGIKSDSFPDGNITTGDSALVYEQASNCQYNVSSEVRDGVAYVTVYLDGDVSYSDVAVMYNPEDVEYRDYDVTSDFEWLMRETTGIKRFSDEYNDLGYIVAGNVAVGRDGGSCSFSGAAFTVEFDIRDGVTASSVSVVRDSKEFLDAYNAKDYKGLMADFVASKPFGDETPEVVTTTFAVSGEAGEVTGEPGKVTDNPGEVTGESGKVTDNPGEVTEEPGKVTDNPGKVTEEPGKVTDNPGEVTIDPGEVVTGPGVTPDVEGDADGNGKVDLADAKIILQIALGIDVDVSEKGKLNADYDHNGRIDLTDAKYALKDALGIKFEIK